ncbi:unnamed protein product [Amoebophrya sp. A120]|nr:unnamed protein product [Amoebophrya sp. A120]|eukprot:GSA120T00012225001.1
MLKSEIPTLLKAACVGSLANMCDSDWFASEFFNSVALLLPQLCEVEGTAYSAVMQTASRIVQKENGVAGSTVTSSLNGGTTATTLNDGAHDPTQILSLLVDATGSVNAEGLHLITEILNFALVCLYAVPLKRRFKNLQVLKLTRFVVEKVYLSICCLSPKHFVDEKRYWRICLLCSKILRVVMRGPLVNKETSQVDALAVVGQSEVFDEDVYNEFTSGGRAGESLYSGGGGPTSGIYYGGMANSMNNSTYPGATGGRVATSGGTMAADNNYNPYTSTTPNSTTSRIPGAPPTEELSLPTSWLFRCFLVRPSGICIRVLMQMISLHGRLLDEKKGILYHRDLEKHRTNVVATSLDLLRILFQRDHLFLQLHQSQSLVGSALQLPDFGNSNAGSMFYNGINTPQNQQQYVRDAYGNLVLVNVAADLHQDHVNNGLGTTTSKKNAALSYSGLEIEHVTAIDELLKQDYALQWPPEDFLGNSSAGEQGNAEDHENPNNTNNNENPFVPRTGTFGDRLRKNYQQLLELSRNSNNANSNNIMDNNILNQKPSNLTLILFYICSINRLSSVSKKAMFVLLQMMNRNSSVVAETLELCPMLKELLSYGLAHNLFELNAAEEIENVSGQQEFSRYLVEKLSTNNLALDFLEECKQHSDAGFAMQEAYSVSTGFSILASLEQQLNLHDDKAVESVDMLLARLLAVNSLKSVSAVGGGGGGVQLGGSRSTSNTTSSMGNKPLFFARERSIRTGYLQDSTLTAENFGFETAGDEEIFQLLQDQYKEEVVPFDQAALAAGRTPGVLPGSVADVNFAMGGGGSGTTSNYKNSTQNSSSSAGNMLNYNTSQNHLGSSFLQNTMADVSGPYRSVRQMQTPQHVGPNGELLNLAGAQSNPGSQPNIGYKPYLPANSTAMPELTKIQRIILHRFQQDQPTKLFPHAYRVPALNRTPLRELVLLVLKEALAVLPKDQDHAEAPASDKQNEKIRLAIAVLGLAKNYQEEHIDLDPARQGGTYLTNSCFQGLYFLAENYPDNLDSVSDLYQRLDEVALAPVVISSTSSGDVIGGGRSRTTAGQQHHHGAIPHSRSKSTAGSQHEPHSSARSSGRRHSGDRTALQSGGAQRSVSATSGAGGANKSRSPRLSSASRSGSPRQPHLSPRLQAAGRAGGHSRSKTTRQEKRTKIHPSCLPSRAQLRQYSDLSIERNHKEYLLVLELILQCVRIAEFREVGLRLLSTSFKSRYRVLDSIADSRTESFRYRPAFLHRILLSQAVTLFKLQTLELSLVHKLAAEFRTKMLLGMRTTNSGINSRKKLLHKQFGMVQEHEDYMELESENLFEDPTIDGTSATAGLLLTPAERQRGEFFQATTQNLADELVSRVNQVTSSNEPLFAANMRHLMDGLAQLSPADIGSGGPRGGSTASSSSAGVAGIRSSSSASLPLDLEQYLKLALDGSQTRSKYYDEPADAAKRRKTGSTARNFGSGSSTSQHFCAEIAAEQGMFVENSSSTLFNAGGTTAGGPPPTDAGRGPGNYMASSNPANNSSQLALMDYGQQQMSNVPFNQQAINTNYTATTSKTATSNALFYDTSSFYQLAGLLFLTPYFESQRQVQSMTTYGTSTGSMGMPVNSVLSTNPGTLAYLDLRARNVCNFLHQQNRRKIAADLTTELGQTFTEFLYWTLIYTKPDHESLRSSFRNLIDAGILSAEKEFFKQKLLAETTATGSSSKQFLMVYSSQNAALQIQLTEAARQEFCANLLYLVTNSLLKASAELLAERTGAREEISNPEEKTQKIFATTATIDNANGSVPMSFFHNLAQKLFSFLPVLNSGTSSASKLAIYSALIQLLGKICGTEVDLAGDEPNSTRVEQRESSQTNPHTRKFLVSSTTEHDQSVSMLLQDALANAKLDSNSINIAVSSLSVLRFLVERDEVLLSANSTYLWQCLKQILNQAFRFAKQTKDMRFVRAVQALVVAMKLQEERGDSSVAGDMDNDQDAPFAARTSAGNTSDDGLSGASSFVTAMYESGFLSLWFQGAASIFLSSEIAGSGLGFGSLTSAAGINTHGAGAPGYNFSRGAGGRANSSLQRTRSETAVLEATALTLIQFLATMIVVETDEGTNEGTNQPFYLCQEQLFQELESFLVNCVEKSQLVQESCTNAVRDLTTISALGVSGTSGGGFLSYNSDAMPSFNNPPRSRMNTRTAQHQQHSNLQRSMQRAASSKSASSVSIALLSQILALLSSCSTHSHLSYVETGTQELSSSSGIMAGRNLSNLVAQQTTTLAIRNDNGNASMGVDVSSGAPAQQVGVGAAGTTSAPSQAVPSISKRSLLLSQLGKDLLIACSASAGLNRDASDMTMHLLNIFRLDLTALITGPRAARIPDTRSLLQQTAPGNLPSGFSAGGSLLGAVRNFFTGQRQSSPYSRPQPRDTTAQPQQSGGVYNGAASRTTSSFPANQQDTSTYNPMLDGQQLAEEIDASGRLLTLAEASRRLNTTAAGLQYAMMHHGSGMDHQTEKENLLSVVQALKENLLYTLVLYAVFLGRPIQEVLGAEQPLVSFEDLKESLFLRELLLV